MGKGAGAVRPSRSRSLPRRTCSLAVAAVLLLLTRAASAETFVARVIGVTDGDTLTVLRAGRPEALRLRGIDAPERGQPYGERAKQHAAALAFGQLVAVGVTDRDRYGRRLADVRLLDGRSLNQELVRAGYAWWFRRYSTDPILARLEAEARLARRGLWADPHPTPPWDYRSERRSRERSQIWGISSTLVSWHGRPMPRRSERPARPAGADGLYPPVPIRRRAATVPVPVRYQLAFDPGSPARGLALPLPGPLAPGYRSRGQGRHPGRGGPGERDNGGERPMRVPRDAGRTFGAPR